MQTVPYGAWASPIAASLAASSAKGFLTLQTDGDDLYWLESRPLEGGRSVLMRADGTPTGQEITPADFNVRTRVHEYGGASFRVANGMAYFTNFADQALYVQDIQSSTAPQRLSRDDQLRFADCEHDTGRDRLICVREDHRGDSEAANALVSMAISGQPSNGEVLWGGSDFVAYPRLNEQGSQLAWISWDHPNMPWDNVALWLADVDDKGQLVNARRLNASFDESVIQPQWADDGSLYFLSDRSGWWNLHRFDGNEISAVHNTAAEFGGPLWGLGASYYALVSSQTALVNYQDAAGEKMGLLNLDDGTLKPFELPFSAYGSLQTLGSKAFFLAGRFDGPSAIVGMDDLTGSAHTVIMDAGESVVDTTDVSRAQAISFPTDDGHTAFAYYYAPLNSEFEAPVGELPPLLVLMHGGPTAATSASFSIANQYWTSRGIAVVDVNYRGSTGYGRDYRQQLNGQWGVVDLQDAVAATQYLIEQGLADPHRLLIRGGSAGGYTTLSALAFTDVFAAGANYFGVADLEALAKHTHKFESRYLDSMVGPYPEALEVYKARSPINALDGFNSPLITFQGLEDQVVPPEQSEMIYQALKAKGTPTAYIPFEGEQHGFRKAENTIQALESELYFYGKVLGFTPHGELPEVVIDNLIE